MPALLLRRAALRSLMLLRRLVWLFAAVLLRERRTRLRRRAVLLRKRRTALRGRRVLLRERRPLLWRSAARRRAGMWGGCARKRDSPIVCDRET